MLESSVVPSETGFWQTGNLHVLAKAHRFDRPLARELARGLTGRTVGDFGCGMGDYVKYFRTRGIQSIGYDGNPHTATVTDGVCGVADLATTCELGIFDYVLSLEVGEHIPMQCEDTFLDNLHRHNRIGIILSWAIVGQKGNGHINCRPNEYIVEKLDNLGYVNDTQWQRELRATASLRWFRSTLMVFARRSLQDQGTSQKMPCPSYV